MKRKDSKGRALRTNEYERPDGRYAYRYIDSKGKSNFIYSWKLVESDSIPKGKPNCDSLREMEKAVNKDVLEGIVAKTKVTLNNRWEEYINNKPELKQSTRTNYKYLYKKYVQDDIGQMPIKSITYTTIKKFFNRLLHEVGFKPNSVESINTILHPVFAIAVRDGLLRINPTDGIMADLKRSNDWDKNPRHALTQEQQLALVKYVKEHPFYNRWHPLIVCLLGTGCRIGEMLGLRWEDIQWSNNIISINHNLIYRVQDNGKMEYHITTTKTRNGNREIPMFESVRNALKQERKIQTKEGFCSSKIDGYSGFIWKNKNNEVLNPFCVNRALKRIQRDFNSDEEKLAKAEHRKPNLLPSFSAHHLRHTFCVRLCEEETDLKLIQEIMGHADISTTMDVYNESNIKRKKERFANLEKTSAIFKAY